MRWLLVLVLSALPAMALDLSVPDGVSVRVETTPGGQIRLPEAPWATDTQPPVATGAIRREILRVPSPLRTTVQLLGELRTRLSQEGFDEAFTCADAGCGGFDFRFQLDILGEPDMHVDLGDFLYVLLRARNPSTEPHTIALLASRSGTAGFVHITTISKTEPAPPASPETPSTGSAPPTADPGDLIATLVDTGHAVLPDLDFGSGSAELGAGSYESLVRISTWLAENPSARIVLVGHTDSIGSLEANTALSERRAASVARFLTSELGASSEQIQASGVGFLAPVASNLNDIDRAANRRVEVVLLSLDN